MMKTKIQLNSCGFDSDNLDDWLENDLRQSGILPSKGDQGGKCIKIEESNDWEKQPFCDGSDDKTVVGDSEMDKTKNDTIFNAASSSTQLAPIIRAFLTTLQQHQQHQQQQQHSGIMIPPLLPFQPSSTSSSLTLASSTSFAPDSINPLQISKTLRVPPTNNMKTSTYQHNNTSATTTATTKRHREMDDAPDVASVMDPLVLKRLKNTDAARRSRQRKLMKMEGLQTRVTELEKRNEQLRSQVTLAENERDAAKVKESRLRDRVATLETQLAEAHQSLVVKQEPLDTEN